MPLLILLKREHALKTDANSFWDRLQRALHASRATKTSPRERIPTHAVADTLCTRSALVAPGATKFSACAQESLQSTPESTKPSWTALGAQRSSSMLSQATCYATVAVAMATATSANQPNTLKPQLEVFVCQLAFAFYLLNFT